jgi:hypothetical protein
MTMRIGKGRVDRRCLASRGDDVLIVGAAFLASSREPCLKKSARTVPVPRRANSIVGIGNRIEHQKTRAPKSAGG